MGQQGVGENETHCGQQQKPHAPVKKTKGNKEERAAQGSGQRRVKIPQKGCSLLGGNRSRRTTQQKKVHVEISAIERIFPSLSFC